MPTDDEDTPKGALIALTLGVIVVLFVVISTFESCTDFEGDRIRDYCSDVRFVMEAPMRENKVCFTSEGELKLSILNTGSIDLEGISLTFMGKQFNQSKKIPALSSQDFSPEIGLKTYELMASIKVTPLVYYPELNSTVACENVQQTITRTEKCVYE